MLATARSLCVVDLISHAGSGYSGNDVDAVCRVRTVFDYSHALIPGNRHYSGSADFVRLCA